MKKTSIIIIFILGLAAIFASLPLQTSLQAALADEKQDETAVEEEDEDKSRSGLPKEEVKAIMETLKDMKEKIEEEGLKSFKFDKSEGDELFARMTSGYGIELEVVEIDGKKEKIKSYVRVPPDIRKLNGKPVADVYVLTASPIGVLQYWVITFEKSGDKWEIAKRDIKFVRNNFYKPSKVTWEPFLFSSIKVRKDQIKLSMKNGKLLVGKVQNKIVGVFAIGEGSAYYEPPAYDKHGMEKFGEMQKQQLKRFTKKTNLKQRVSEMFFYSSPEELQRIVDSTRPKPITDEDEVFFLKDEAKIRYEERLKYVNDNGMEKFSIISNEDDDKFMWFIEDPPNGGDAIFCAMFNTRDWQWLTYLYNPEGIAHPWVIEETMLTKQAEYTLYFSDYRKWKIWQLFHSKADRDNLTRMEITSKEKDDIDITYQKCDISVKPITYFYKNKTDVSFRPLKHDVDMVKFELSNRLSISSVIDENDRQLLPIRVGGSIVLPLDKPLVRGKEYTFSWKLSGNFISQWLAGLFTPLNTFAWLPTYGYLKPAIVELKIKVPKEYYTSAVGELIEEKYEGDYYVSHWKSSRPIILPGFCFGKYKRIIDDKTVKDVKIYSYNTQDNLQFIFDYSWVNKYDIRKKSLGWDRIFDWDKRYKGQDTKETRRYTGLPFERTLNLAPKKYLELAGNVVNFYSNLLQAPYPYKKLALTQMLYEAGFGQGMPGFLILAGTSYMSPAQKAAWGWFKPNWATSFMSHEIAHQWWGHLIPWRGIRDQWLSESFAQITAAEYVKAELGLDDYLFEMMEWESLGKENDDKGPIGLGYIQLQEGYQGLIYFKGPYVLHMLKMSLPSTKAFFKILANFCRYKPFRPNTNEDFQFVVEKSLGKKNMQLLYKENDMKWFFDQWLYSSGYPKFAYDYKIKKDGDRYVANVYIEQQRVKFKVPIKLWGHFQGNKKHAFRVIVDKEKNRFQIPMVDEKGNPLGKPKKLVLNEFKSVFCDVEKM